MGRPHWHPKKCRICGRSSDEVGNISQTGLCFDHSMERFEANYYALKSKRGPFAHWWAYKLAASVGLAPLDSAPPEP